MYVEDILVTFPQHIKYCHRLTVILETFVCTPYDVKRKKNARNAIGYKYTNTSLLL